MSWPEGMGRESLLALDFVERREDLVLTGDVGTGKTHMASALCALACERRLEARLFTASSLVMRLRRARDDGRLDREAALIGKARLLVIDELGFLPLDADGARLLFQVFADAYERQSVAITANLAFSRWGSVFGDDQMAAAVIDRIVHHGRLVQFRGESYRVRHALMQEGQPLKKRARFRCSGCSISDDLFAQILLTKHNAELDFHGARDEHPHVVAAAVDLPARRPFVALGPDELGRLLVERRVERLLDGLPNRFLMSLRNDSSSIDEMFADTARAPSSMTCCLAARNHMTGRGPCSAMQLSIRERNYVSPTPPSD